MGDLSRPGGSGGRGVGGAFFWGEAMPEGGVPLLTPPVEPEEPIEPELDEAVGDTEPEPVALEGLPRGEMADPSITGGCSECR